LKSRMLTTKKI